MPSHMSPVEKPSPKGGKGPLIAVIVLFTVVVLLGGAYVAGALAFNQYFMPGTTLDGEDVSMRTVSDVAAEKSRELDDLRPVRDREREHMGVAPRDRSAAQPQLRGIYLL